MLLMLHNIDRKLSTVFSRCQRSVWGAFIGLHRDAVLCREFRKIL